MYQDTAAFTLVRALRMELHSSHHLCGVLLRELYSTESNHGGDEILMHATLKQRLGSLQDALLSQQKR